MEEKFDFFFLFRFFVLFFVFFFFAFVFVLVYRLSSPQNMYTRTIRWWLNISEFISMIQLSFYFFCIKILWLFFWLIFPFNRSPLDTLIDRLLLLMLILIIIINIIIIIVNQLHQSFLLCFIHIEYFLFCYSQAFNFLSHKQQSQYRIIVVFAKRFDG